MSFVKTKQTFETGDYLAVLDETLSYPVALGDFIEVEKSGKFLLRTHHSEIGRHGRASTRYAQWSYAPERCILWTEFAEQRRTMNEAKLCM